MNLNKEDVERIIRTLLTEQLSLQTSRFLAGTRVQLVLGGTVISEVTVIHD